MAWRDQQLDAAEAFTLVAKEIGLSSFGSGSKIHLVERQERTV